MRNGKTTNADLRPGILVVCMTDEHIKNGKPNDVYNCPLALAIRPSFPGFTVKVLRSSVQIFPKKGNKGLYAKLPTEATALTADFDNGKPVEPLIFAIDLRI